MRLFTFNLPAFPRVCSSFFGKKQLGFALMLCLALFSCKKNKNSSAATGADFTAGSSAFVDNGTYPKKYTCDSIGVAPPLFWKNAPAGTAGYAITMHHIPPTGDKHVYMTIYNIAGSIAEIPENSKSIGLFGINTVDGKTSYTPPCSQGPGPKVYVITVYALSSAPVMTVPQNQVTMDVLLNAISTKTLAKSVINVTYTR